MNRIEQTTVGDHSEILDAIHFLFTSEQQIVSLPLTTQCSLAVTTIVHNKAIEMDLQKNLKKSVPKQKYSSVLRNPRLWVPTRKTRYLPFPPLQTEEIQLLQIGMIGCYILISLNSYKSI